MTTDRRLAATAALLYLVTWITSVGALPLYENGGRSQVLAGALLEVILAAAVVGTSVALSPLLCAGPAMRARSAMSPSQCWKLV